MSLATLLVVLLFGGALALAVSAETSDEPRYRSQVQWADELLPAGSYQVDESAHGVARVRLTQTVRLQGIGYGPGHIHFDQSGRVDSGVLARDDTVAGLPLRGGTAIHIEHGPFRRRLVRFTPRVPIERWDLRCAADEEVDLTERSAVLADDHVYERLTLPAGSRFGHDIDWGGLWVVLARAVEVAGHRLPAGATVHLDDHTIHPDRHRWLRSWLGGPPKHLVTVVHAEAWQLGPVPVAAKTYVPIRMDGLAVVRLQEDWLVGGLRYPAGSSVTIDAEGRLRAWRAGFGGDGPRPSPYR